MFCGRSNTRPCWWRGKSAVELVHSTSEYSGQAAKSRWQEAARGKAPSSTAWNDYIEQGVGCVDV